MKFLALILSIIFTAAFIGIPSTGCATLQSIVATTGEPKTPSEQLDAAQADLEFVKAGANLAHELGRFQKPGEWERVQGAFANTQLIINAARVNISEENVDQVVITDLMNQVAQAVHDAKETAK
jgi:hypothetical protein